MQPYKQASAITEVTHLPYEHTGYFSRIVIDYLDQNTQLSSFYKYEVNIEGIKKAIADRSGYSYNRSLLVSALKKQYEGTNVPENVKKNIDLLSKETTFTITTAHQPNIFTGPLYFIYKIIHAIKIADTLKLQMPENDFVPVFFMGSEDADLDELGHFTVDGKQYQWQTKQTGAVGRMKVDKAFISLISELENQLGVLPHGNEIAALFRSSYTEGATIQQCTLKLVNAMFGEYGLIVLIPDDPALKSLFKPVIEKELKEQFSHKVVEQTINELSKNYKVQAGGRDLNLFYLLDDKRERIEFSESKYKVQRLGLAFSPEEILNELESHPERFSPNVILRGVFQEMILPNIVFIGGGGEIAYWLELQKVFEAVEVPYPMLLLRNSFLLMRNEQQDRLSVLQFGLTDLFKNLEGLLNQLTKRDTSNQLSLSEEIGELNSFYQQLHDTAYKIDPTLAGHVNTLQAKALKRINELEKKMLRAEKRKFEAEKRQIQKLKNELFPNESLQERVENISGFYAKQGRSLIDKLYQHSPGLEQQFTVIKL